MTSLGKHVALICLVSRFNAYIRCFICMIASALDTYTHTATNGYESLYVRRESIMDYTFSIFIYPFLELHLHKVEKQSAQFYVATTKHNAKVPQNEKIEVLLKSNWSSLSRFEGMHYMDDASVLSSNNRIIQMMHLFFIYVLIIIKISTQLELHRYFYSVGAGVIEEVRLQCDKGFGFVTSNNHAEVALAIQMGNTQ
ncbi:Nucleotide-binding, alpha-beta plait [Artemisia annua]|uniref:Nucleotide-binding, alpha-beta plait n=1 Tax=Artemisia annua TaxID=35608 RepID=A0A2U1K9R9_ARTAN|nr:Nucleotide-binding, alpha-beta plait [Artemisia annua]